MNFRPRKRPSWLRILTVLFLAGVGFVGIFGGPILSRHWDNWWNEVQLDRFLHQCAPDEVRFCSFMATRSGQSFRLSVDLQTGAATRSGGESRVKRGLFWQPILRSGSPIISWPLNMPDRYSPEQLERIKTDLKGFQSMEPIRIDPSRFDNYLAFYRGPTLVICQEKGSASSLPFRDLYHVLFLETGSVR